MKNTYIEFGKEIRRSQRTFWNSDRLLYFEIRAS